MRDVTFNPAVGHAAAKETLMHIARWAIASLVAMTIVTFADPARASVTITLGTASARAGRIAAIPVSMAGGTNVAGVQLDIVFPASVVQVANPTAACTLAAGLPGSVSTDLVDVPGTPPGMGRLRVVLLDFGGGTYAAGPLFTCGFTVAGSASTGTYPVSGTQLVVSDDVGAVLGSTLQAGAVMVTRCTGCCS